jgi:carbohydrate kinase (thermoresistant glucokinase family)
MGVSGSGKTTIGKRLSKKTGIPFYDGDDFHPDVNIRKMTEGTPLTDRDRVAWIEQISGFINSAPSKHKILACSALNKFIRGLIIKKIREKCYFVFLKGSYDLIKERMKRREDHYMKAGMLESQFEALEEPENALIIDIENSPDRVCDVIYNVIIEKPEIRRQTPEGRGQRTDYIVG